MNKLVGMAVYHEGTAINDQTGVININAENGQAFYNDGTGLIINYGTICTFGVCQGLMSIIRRIIISPICMMMAMY